MTAASISTAERLLWLISTIAGTALVFRLSVIRLHGVYRFFFSLIVLTLCRSLIFWFSDPGSSAYQWAWRITQPVFWVLQILVVGEIYSKVFKDYEGIYSLGRWLFYGAAVVSLAVSVLSLAPTLVGLKEPAFSFQHFTLIERGVSFGLALFLLLIASFLFWYPIPLSRNIIIHSLLYGAFFITNTAGLLIINMVGNQASRAVSMVLLGISTVFLAAWSVFLNREGEVKPVVLRSYWSAAEEKRLIDQLNAINSTLLRSALRRSK
jgi:hypothetical protein